MNKRQQILVVLLQDVIILFENNRDLWTSIVPVTDAFNRFRSVAEEFKVINVSQQKHDTKGYTNHLNQTKKQLIDSCCSLILKTAAYASFIGDIVLLEAVNISRTDLRNLSTQNLLADAQIIHDYALTVKSASADFKITDEHLSALLYHIYTINTTISKRNAAGDTRTLITAEITDLEKQCFTLLAMLDNAVTGFIEDNPTFVKAYKQARKLEDTTGRKRTKVLAEDTV